MGETMTEKGPSDSPVALSEQPGGETHLLHKMANGMSAQDELTNGNRHRFEKFLGRLAKLGLIEADGAPAPTHLGLEIAPFLSGNINVRMGVVLAASRWYGTSGYAFTLVSILAAQEPFFQYPEERLEKALAAHRTFRLEGSSSDLTTLLYAFQLLQGRYIKGGEPAASEFARTNFLNFKAFLEILTIRESLLTTARSIGWSLEETASSPEDLLAIEENLAATLFWAYFDRLLRKGWDFYTWETVDKFEWRLRPDSQHYPSSTAELILCVGVVWTTGHPTGAIYNVAGVAISPELIRMMVGDAVLVQIESLEVEGGYQAAFDVWYWGDARLVVRGSDLPDGSPLEIARELRRRSPEYIPLLEPPSGSTANPGWRDLADWAQLPDLQAMLARTWASFPNHLRVGEHWCQVEYADNLSITLIIAGEHTAILVSNLIPDDLPAAWSGRAVSISVDSGDGHPFTCAFEELSTLKELLGEPQAPKGEALDDGSQG
jgi:hypothetical protein